MKLREARGLGWTAPTPVPISQHQAGADFTDLGRGHPAGDSTRVDRPIEESWSSVTGTRTGPWSVRFSFHPVWTRGLVGSLTVQGKGDLTKWSRDADPVRWAAVPRWGGGKPVFDNNQRSAHLDFLLSTPHISSHFLRSSALPPSSLFPFSVRLPHFQVSPNHPSAMISAIRQLQPKPDVESVHN